MQKDGPVKQMYAYLIVAFAEHTRKLRVMRLLMIMFIVAHVMCCLLGLSTTFGEEKLHSWLGTHGYCWPDDLYSLGRSEPYKSRCVDAGSQYLICFHLALSLCFKIPFGPFVLQGPGEPYWHNTESNAMFQPPEHAIFVIVGLVGAMQGMFITGTFVAVVAAKNGATVTEQVTSFCRKYNVSHTSRKQMLTYFNSLGELSGTTPSGNLFYRLSPNLLIELTLDVHGKWLYKLPFSNCLYSHFLVAGERSPMAKKLGDALLTKLCLAMTPALFIQRERPNSGKMYVVVKGVALQLTTRGVLKASDSWGAYSLLVSQSVHTAVLGTVRALTTIQCVFIDQDKFRKIPQDNPEVWPAYTRIRAWAMLKRLFYGITRAVVKERLRVLDPSSPTASPHWQRVQSGLHLVLEDAAEAQAAKELSAEQLVQDKPSYITQIVPASPGVHVGPSASQIEPLALQVGLLQKRMGGVESQLAKLCNLIEQQQQQQAAHALPATDRSPGHGPQSPEETAGRSQSADRSQGGSQRPPAASSRAPLVSSRGFFSAFQRPSSHDDNPNNPLAV